MYQVFCDYLDCILLCMIRATNSNCLVNHLCCVVNFVFDSRFLLTGRAFAYRKGILTGLGSMHALSVFCRNTANSGRSTIFIQHISYSVTAPPYVFAVYQYTLLKLVFSPVLLRQFICMVRNQLIYDSVSKEANW